MTRRTGTGRSGRDAPTGGTGARTADQARARRESKVRASVCATCIYRTDSPLDLERLEAEIRDRREFLQRVPPSATTTAKPAAAVSGTGTRTRAWSARLRNGSTSSSPPTRARCLAPECGPPRTLDEVRAGDGASPPPEPAAVAQGAPAKRRRIPPARHARSDHVPPPRAAAAPHHPHHSCVRRRERSRRCRVRSASEAPIMMDTHVMSTINPLL